MYRIKRIFESVVVRVLSIVLFVSFLLSGFFCFDFYQRQVNKIKGYYWVYQGDKAYKKDNLQSAISCYQRGIKLHPKHYRAMFNLANIYVVYEDYYAAIENYEKALRVKPDFENARIDYAIILAQTYQINKAIEQYEKVIENKPRFIKIPFLVDNKKSYNHNRGVAYYNMGIAYRAKSLLAGNTKQTSRAYLSKAQKSYEEAADILKSYNSNYNLALVNQVLRNQYQAGYYYCRAIAISPMEYEAHFNLAVLLNELKQYKKASEEFKKAALLLDSKGDSSTIKYIYDMLSEVNQKATIEEKKSKDDTKKETQQEDIKLQYKNGKVVLLEKSDGEEDFKNSFKTCSASELFMKEEE